METRRYHLVFWVIVVGLLALGLLVFRDILLPFILGIMIAFLLHPFADALERWGMGRTGAALLIVAGVVLAIFLTLFFLVPMVLAQLKQLATTLPGDLNRMRGAFDTFAQDHLGGHFPAFRSAVDKLIGDLQNGWASSAGQVLPSLLSRSMALLNVLSVLFLTPLVAFYLLVDWHRMLAAIERWLPRDHAATIKGLAGDIDAAVAAFIRGQGTVCLVLGVFYAIALALIGLDHGLIIGLATGLLGFIPVVGWVLGLLTALVLAIAQFGVAPGPLALVAGVFAAGMAIDTAFLSPRLVGEKIGLHPVWLIFALFAFSYLFGFVGTLVAVPLAAAALVLVRHALKVYMESDVYLGASQNPKEPS